MGFNMAITINSLITNLPPGRVISSAAAGPLSAKDQLPTAERAVVFSPNEPWPQQTGAKVNPNYDRRAVIGPRSNAVSPAQVNSPQAEQDPAAKDTAADSSDSKKVQLSSDAVKKPNGEFLSKAEMALLRELQKADQAVKAHEMAHVAAAGGYAKGGASFSYQRGPDGQNYAIGGEVQVDTSRESTPEATIQKMQIVRQAALAPVDPSPQDQQVAAHATLQISASFKELRLAQAQQPSTPLTPTKDEAGTTAGIDQGSDLARKSGSGAAPGAPANSARLYASYLTPLSPTTRSDQHAVDRMA